MVATSRARHLPCARATQQFAACTRDRLDAARNRVTQRPCVERGAIVADVVVVRSVGRPPAVAFDYPLRLAVAERHALHDRHRNRERVCERVFEGVCERVCEWTAVERDVERARGVASLADPGVSALRDEVGAGLSEALESGQ